MLYDYDVKRSILSCLESGYTDPIRDVLWGHIYLTPGLAALTRSKAFMRLHRIMQLGPAFCVYPGATHTRASHSIGVYHLARRLLIFLAERGADAWLSPEGVFSFLCAALFHDLGHFPYTHSLKELPLESHETLTSDIICAEPVKSLVSAAGGNPEFTAAVVNTAYSGAINQGEQTELFFYRRLLSGTLDPDKLDYLNRDARYCGVPYGAQDVDFILSCLQPHPERGADISGRGIPSVESILFSKYLMYRTVYWHRSVRSATSMIKKALLNGLETKYISGKDLYNLDDQGLFALASQKAAKVKGGFSKQLFSLVDLVKEGRLFLTAAEIPFDDNVHGDLLSLSNRSHMEEELAPELSAVFGKKLSADSIIIDLPEPISFEIGLFITDEKCFFADGPSVFKNDLVNAFVKSLRIIRVFVDSRYEDEVKIYSKKILKITQKWLNL